MTYTRDEVAVAANAAADMLIEECDLSSDRVDLINIVVNAVLTSLDQDGTVTLADVAEANYDEEVDADTLGRWANGQD